MNLEKRKNALLKKLESLKSEPGNASSQTQFCFEGQCRCKHLIETNIDKTLHGIQFGEFIKLINRGCEHISVCVGLGLMCKEDPEYSPENYVLWFLEEEYHGVTYWRDFNIDSIKDKSKKDNIELI
jgi:hypothetical protein